MATPLAQPGARAVTRFGRALAGLALLAPHLVGALAADETSTAAGHSHAARPPTQRTAAATLEGRVQLLAKELALDSVQQSQLRDILQSQRVEVARVWSDPAVPASVRVGATQSIGEKTGDRIRAILNAEQREKYMKAHQHDAPVGAPGSDNADLDEGRPGTGKAGDGSAGRNERN